MKKPKIIHINPLNLHFFPQKAENKCSYCYKTYSRSDVLKNHLLICKVKKQEIEEKKSILNRLLEQNTLLVSTIYQQKEQIQQLIKTNENLMNHMKTNQIQNNKNVKHQNNGTINNTINIVGFGKEDQSKIDNKEL
jgi:hypothetical protein